MNLCLIMNSRLHTICNLLFLLFFPCALLTGERGGKVDRELRKIL